MKTIIFVDASNLYHSIKEMGFIPGKVDYHKLFSYISNTKDPFVRFYTAPKRTEQGLKQRSAQDSFFDNLRKNPNLTIHFGKLQLIKGENFLTFREKGVDVKLAVDLIILAENKEYDIAILVSGDTDLVPAVEKVVLKQKRIINAYFSKSSGKELRDKSSACFVINKEILINCLKGPADPFKKNQRGVK